MRINKVDEKLKLKKSLNYKIQFSSTNIKSQTKLFLKITMHINV